MRDEEGQRHRGLYIGTTEGFHVSTAEGSREHQREIVEQVVEQGME